MNDCIFCKIAQGQIPSKIAYEDENVMAFYDQDPQAQSCGVLLTNQEESRVNSSLSVWQTDAIIGENGQGWAFSQPGEATVLAVEDGCLAVEITPAGAVTARRES